MKSIFKLFLFCFLSPLACNGMTKTVLNPALFNNVIRKSNPCATHNQYAFYGSFHKNTDLANSELTCIVWSNEPLTNIYAIYAYLTTYKNKQYNIVESVKVVNLDKNEISKLSNLVDYFNTF